MHALTGMRRALLTVSTMLLSCTSSNPVPGSVRVLVNVEPNLRSRCARVIARGNVQRDSSAVRLGARTHFVIGIAQEDEPTEVFVQAQGYSDDACTVPSVPAENSELLSTRFASPSTAVMVTLRSGRAAVPDAGVDADGDGFPAGLDCDDSNAAIHPTATEVCSNGVDDDCDLAPDCADPSCEALACGLNGHCAGARCLAPTESGLCGDALDNDGDGQVDCQDSDCPSGVSCSDGNACTSSDACTGGSCVGAAVECTHPPAGQCVATTGRCLPDAGGTCSYPPLTGSCDDGLACTASDTCGADGSCSGTPKRCDTPPGPCFASVGQCSESQAGACVYSVRTGSCDDSNNCTRDDVCDGAGHCGGTAVTCTPPGECFTSSTGCAPDGRCLFSVRSGACAGGACDAAGNCVPTAPAFPYTPSNFTPAQLPASGGAMVASCDVTIDTQTGSGGIGWSTCSGGPAAPPSAVTPGGAVLILLESLTINSGVTVQAVGARPLIIAVGGAVVINGVLSANSTGVRGAGSDIACSSGAGESGNESGNPETAGGGGGGGFLTDGAQGSDGSHGGRKGDKGRQNGEGSLTPLRGGCRGGNGGHEAPGSATGGRGGGALQVSAGGTLTLGGSGSVTAQGEGGKGGQAGSRAGGGGGGSGGAIVLEASNLVIRGGSAVVANGGAGGEGSGSFVRGTDGQSGQRGYTRASSFSFTCGGNGGEGGVRWRGPDGGGRPSCDLNSPGGGGGGSAGRIRLRAVNGCSLSDSAVVSPQASTNCEN